MRRSSAAGSARAYIGDFRNRVAMQSRQVPDPFGTNPIKRSLIGALVSLAIIIVPFQISHEAGTSVMLSVGWFAMAVLVFTTPIFLWSVAEKIYRTVDHRIHPSVDDLDIPVRIIHVLHRHGADTIRDVIRMDDAELLLMSNLEPRDVGALRRAVSLWRYRRWQEAGFPASGAD